MTIIADSNDHTIGKSKYIRLLSCSLYNSWYNLRRRGEISISDRKDNTSIQLIPPAILCKYSLESLTKPEEEILSEEKGLTVSMNQWQFLIPKKRDLNSIEIVLYPSRLISVCKRKKLHLSIYFFQQLSCPLWSFGQGWKPIQWGTLKRSWLLWHSREPVWKGKLFSTESCVAKNNTMERYHFHTYRKSSSEVDVDAIKEQIREDYRKKLASLVNITK